MHRPLSVGAPRLKEKAPAAASVDFNVLLQRVRPTRRQFMILCGGMTVAGAIGGGVALDHHIQTENRREEEREKIESLQPIVDRLLSFNGKYGTTVKQLSEGTKILIVLELPKAREETSLPSWSERGKERSRPYDDAEYDVLWLTARLREQTGISISTMYADFNDDSYPGGWMSDSQEIENVDWATKQMKRAGTIEPSDLSSQKESRYEEISRMLHVENKEKPHVRDEENTDLHARVLVTRAGEGIDRGMHRESLAGFTVRREQEHIPGVPTFGVIHISMPAHELVLAQEEEKRKLEEQVLLAAEQKRQKTINQTVRGLYSLLFRLAGR